MSNSKFFLPFEIPSNEPETEDIYIVEDSLGNRLPIPKFGCVTWIENREYKRNLSKLITDNAPMDELYLASVEVLLRSRFNVPKNVKTEELFVLQNGKPVPWPMVEALFRFFEQEINEWNPNAPSMMQEAKRIAGQQTVETNAVSVEEEVELDSEGNAVENLPMKSGRKSSGGFKPGSQMKTDSTTKTSQTALSA